jgi:hypothetical protein
LRVGMAEWQHRTQSNNSLNPTGNSLPLIENLSHDAVDSRRVNSGVSRGGILTLSHTKIMLAK